MKARWIAEAIGATLILLFPVLATLISPWHLFIYHHQQPLTPLMDGLLLDVTALAVGGVLVLALLPRLPAALGRAIGGCLTGLFLWTLANDAIILLTDWSGSDLSQLPHPTALSSVWIWWQRWGFRLVVVIPPLLAVLAWPRAQIARPMVRATRLAVAAAALCALWIVPELLYLDLRSRETKTFAASQARAQPGGKPRIVWILFDELSYKLALSQPPEGQEFPNLQKLHAESVSFGNLTPAGNFTDVIIPSVLAGRQISEIRGTPEGKLLYLDQARHAWAAYDVEGTLFEVAHDNGWNPGVVGWYIPYCRIFGEVLTRCFWAPGSRMSFELWAGEGDSAFSYALALPRAFMAQVYSRRQIDERRLQGMIQDDASLIKQEQSILEDERVRFVYIHLPVPHPPGVYDRRTHRPCACGNYLDNLTFADDMLGRLMREIGRSSGAEGATVIVSSDHSWRVPMWKSTPYWTAEEERISGGRFDTRPVFMIHFAGERSGSEVLAPLPELVEYDVIAGMLEGKIRGPEDLEELVRPQARVAGARLVRH
jgi:hypothetical protein